MKKLAVALVVVLAILGISSQFVTSEGIARSALYLRGLVYQSSGMPGTTERLIADINAVDFTRPAYAQDEEGYESPAVEIINIYSLNLVDASGDVRVAADTGFGSMETMAMNDVAFAFLPSLIHRGDGHAYNVSVGDGKEDTMTLADGLYTIYGRTKAWRDHATEAIVRDLQIRGHIGHAVSAAVVFLPTNFGWNQTYQYDADGVPVFLITVSEDFHKVAQELHTLGILPENPEYAEPTPQSAN